MKRAPQAWLALALAGCSEFAIADNPKDPPQTDTDPPEDTDVPDTDPPVAPCADVTIDVDPWTATAPFAEQADPVDGDAHPFWSPDHDGTGFSPITLPDDNGIPAGRDRAYRTMFRVTGTSGAIALDLQSDDGIAVWIDGQEVGRWGGAWQEEGCVNDDAQCGSFVLVEAVDVSDLATPGVHDLAFRVSNAVVNSYADVRLFCDPDAP